MRRRVIDHRSARFGVPEAGVAHVCIPGKRCRHSKGPRVAGCEIGTYVFNCIRSTCDPALIGLRIAFRAVPACGPVEEARDAPPSHRAHPRRGQGSAHAGPGPGTVSDSTHVDWVEWASGGRTSHGHTVATSTASRFSPLRIHVATRDLAIQQRHRASVHGSARRPDFASASASPHISSRPQRALQYAMLPIGHPSSSMLCCMHHTPHLPCSEYRVTADMGHTTLQSCVHSLKSCVHSIQPSCARRVALRSPGRRVRKLRRGNAPVSPRRHS